MISYKGIRRDYEAMTVAAVKKVIMSEGGDVAELDLLPEASQAIRNHSPDGFNWGYGGSGPAQLSLAICLDYFGERAALMIYQDFKVHFASKWGDSWEVHDYEIDEWFRKRWSV